MYPVDARDLNRRVLVQGKDNNDMTVLTTDPGTGQAGAGEYLVLKFPFVDSLNLFPRSMGYRRTKLRTYPVLPGGPRDGG